MKTPIIFALTLLSFAGVTYANAEDTTATTTGKYVTSQREQNDKFMKPFYTDESMTTVKTGDDFVAAYKSMSPEDLAMMKEMCAQSASQKDTTCVSFNAVNSQ